MLVRERIFLYVRDAEATANEIHRATKIPLGSVRSHLYLLKMMGKVEQAGLRPGVRRAETIWKAV